MKKGAAVSIERISKTLLSWGLVWFLSAVSAQADVQAPVPITPANGAVLQLPLGVDTLLLRWTEVPEATGYLLNVNGPEDFVDLVDIDVDQAPGTVEITINDVVPGDYVWTVRAVAPDQIVSSSPFFFTIQSPPSGGGNLPAPDPLQPRDLALFLGTNGTITFQWTRIEGAESYQLELSSLDSSSSFFRITNPIEEGTVVRQTFQIAPGNKTRIYNWSVAAVDGSGSGKPSRERSFVFVPKHAESRDLMLLIASQWHVLNSFMDVDGDAETDQNDALALIPFQQNREPFTIDSAGPNLVIPSSGASVRQTNITFLWNTIPGARSYELIVLDSQQMAVTTHLIAQSGTVNPSTVVGFLAEGDYTWEVRALFGSGKNATRFSGPQPFSVGSGNPGPGKGSRRP